MLRTTVVSFTDSKTGKTHMIKWEELKRYMEAYKVEFGRVPTRDELFAYAIGERS